MIIDLSYAALLFNVLVIKIVERYIIRWVNEMNKKLLPERKPTRLKGYDYGFAGAYFITVCIRKRMQILSEIELTSVGEGLARNPQSSHIRFGEPHALLPLFAKNG